ncbi:MAG: DUF4258 domain-containing protein [Ginsengibacter sp.]
MKKKYFIISILAIIIILGIALGKKHNFFKSSVNESSLRDTNHLILTKHARCRMECRHITTEEIKEIVYRGNVNYSKSGQGNKGDDTYALEGYSNEHQHLRVVVAPENDGLVVITCIDLDSEWPCNCY